MACKRHAMNIINSVFEFIKENPISDLGEPGRYWFESNVKFLNGCRSWLNLIDDTYKYVLNRMCVIRNMMMYEISKQLDRYKTQQEKCLRACPRVCSKIRILYWYSKNIVKAHTRHMWILNDEYMNAKEIAEKDRLLFKSGMRVLYSMQDVVIMFSKEIVFNHITSCDDTYADFRDVISGRYNGSGSRHVIFDAMEYVIPGTGNSVFEFLIMDLNLTHLPILNHEELMVEKFKKLDHLIRDRCKKLNEIYDIHLMFKKVNSNFPEDCTNHVFHCKNNR